MAVGAKCADAVPPICYDPPLLLIVAARDYVCYNKVNLEFAYTSNG